VNFGTPTFSDACGAVTLTPGNTTVTHGPAGQRINCKNWQAVDACGNTSTCQQCITVPICEEHCSNGQGFYGNLTGKSCTNLTAEQSINLALQTGAITVGCSTQAVTILPGEASCVVRKFPGGSTPSVLPSPAVSCSTATGNSYLKQNRFKSVLLSQTLTLAFNIRLDNSLGNLHITNNYFSTYKASSCTNGTPISGTRQVFFIPQSVRNCIGANGTVNDLLALANKALGGGTTGGAAPCGLPGGCTGNLSDITTALDAINTGFEKCRILGDFASTSSAAKISNQLSEEFVKGIAMNVYPNPFSENATIEFTVAESGDATIELYNLTGSRIAELYHGYVEQDEVYQATIDAKNLPQGIYLCRCTTSNYSSTIRTLIMK